MERVQAMRFLRTLTCLAVCLSPVVAQAEDAAWGHLTGRLVYDGAPPPARTFAVTKDLEFLGETLTDESLLVHATNRGLANVVVYLLDEIDDPASVHPSYAETAEATVELTMAGGRFEPHVLLLRTTQTMRQRNLDPITYNALIQVQRNRPASHLVTPRAGHELRLPVEERIPCAVSCAVHPWMRGYVLVRSNPYMAKTDANGKFEIQHLPVGRHEFRLWHERTGFLSNVRWDSSHTDAKGRFTVEVRESGNDLGDLSLEPARFAENK